MRNNNEVKRSLGLGFLRPVSFALLAFACLDLSCSQPPAPIQIKSSGADLEPGDGDAVGEPADGDSNQLPTPVSNQTPIPTTPSVPTTTPNVPSPTTPAPPGPMPQVPEFKACLDQSEKCHPHVFILADEPLRKILLVNLDDPKKDWDLNIPYGARDLQLIGGGKLLVGTLDDGGGYHEVDIATGKIVKSVIGFGAVGAVQRLVNGNTLVMGEGLDNTPGATVVLETDPAKKIVNKYVFKGVTGGRMIRRTPAGTVLVGKGNNNKDFMLEMTKEGQEIWRAENNNWPAHMALRLPSGDTVVASGHGKTLLFFDKAAKLKKSIGGPTAAEAADVKPHYSGAFFLMPNGNFIMTNWQGHENNLGSSGRQIIEYNADGKLVWYWKQDAKRISSVHNILVLDNLDLTKMHDDVNGILSPSK